MAEGLLLSVQIRMVSKYGYGGRWLAEKMEDAKMAKRHVELWSGISKKRQARIRREIEEELKENLIEELTPVLAEQAEQNVRDQAERDALIRAKKELREEAEEARPTGREREAFQDFVRQIEVDCHAQAVVASNRADQNDRDASWSRWLRGALALAVTAALVFTAYATLSVWGFAPVTAIASGVAGLVLLFILISNFRARRRFEKASVKRRKTASDYLVVAERARAFRTVHAERLESRRELDGLVKRLQDDKEKLDQDHHLRVEDLYAAQDSVRSRVSLEDIPSLDDFDQRLEEAEAEALEAESRAEVRRT